MKKILTFVLAAVLLIGMATTASAQTVLKLAEVHAEGYPTALADVEFARLVEEKTEGRIKVEVYLGGTLYGTEPASIEALQLGDLAFTRVSASPVSQFVPSINAIQMPYLYKSGDHMWAVLNGEIGQSFLQGIEDHPTAGLIGLCYYDAGSRSFYLTKEVHTVADMAGLKIRVQDNQMMKRMVELLGATPVTGIGPMMSSRTSQPASSTALRITGRPTRTWATTKLPNSISSTSIPAYRRSCWLQRLRWPS